MSELHEQPFPRSVLLSALGLIVVAITLSGLGRFTQIGTVGNPESSAVATRSLWFEDRPDGSVAVYSRPDARSDAGSAGALSTGRSVREDAIAMLQPGTNGFIRSVMRGLARERRQQGVGAEAPFRLTRWSDGRLSLEDETTGRRVELNAFGPTNAGAFAAFLRTDSDDRELALVH